MRTDNGTGECGAKPKWVLMMSFKSRGLKSCNLVFIDWSGPPDHLRMMNQVFDILSLLNEIELY